MALVTNNLWIDVFGFVVALIAVGVVYLKRCFSYWEKKGIPYVQPSIPFGNARDMFLQRISFGDNVAELYDRLKHHGGKFFGMFVFHQPVLVATDPELIKNILAKDFDHFVDRGVYVNEKGDPLGAHLFSLEGTRWRNLRVKLTPTFTSGKMKMMFQTLVDCSDGLAQIVEDSGENPVDIKDVVGRFTTDVIGSCAFGLDCNSLENPDTEFRIQGKKIFRPTVWDSVKGFIGFVAPNVLRFFNGTVTNKDVTKFFMSVVRETIDYREKNNVKRKDFMNLLLQLKNTGKLEDDEHENDKHGKDSDTDTKLTFEQIAAQSFLFFVAGFETSSTLLTFCFYELVKNIGLQEKLREEIVEVLDKHDGKITYEGLIMEMKYMDNVINETLRKYPPIPVLSRVCTKEYNLPEMKLHVPEGEIVFLPAWSVQRDPKHYPNPENFDPDRFTEEGKKTRHPYSFFPFGEGPRNCIGLRFGIMQTKVALTVLLKNFKFTLNEKTHEPIVMEPISFVTSAEGGIWLNATKIEI